jgi:hypothetical protein
MWWHRTVRCSSQPAEQVGADAECISQRPQQAARAPDKHTAQCAHRPPQLRMCRQPLLGKASTPLRDSGFFKTHHVVCKDAPVASTVAAQQETDLGGQGRGRGRGGRGPMGACGHARARRRRRRGKARPPRATASPRLAALACR